MSDQNTPGILTAARELSDEAKMPCFKICDMPTECQRLGRCWRIGANETVESAKADLAAEKKSAALRGYAYFNPDTGMEWSVHHPITSGECPDATDVRAMSLGWFRAKYPAETSDHIGNFDRAIEKARADG